MLSRRNVGEADRLITLLTEDYGIIKAVAKGVRKVPSSRGGHLEPLTQVIVLLRTSRSLSADRQASTYIGAVETEEYFVDLKANPTALTHAQAMVHLAISLFGEEDPHPYIYSALYQAFKELPYVSEAKQNVLEGSVLLLILREAGVLPNWKNCQRCKIPQPADAVILDAVHGGWRCLSCHRSLSGTEYSLAPDGLKVLRYLSRHPEHALRLAVHHGVTQQMIVSLRWYIATMLQNSHLSRV